MYILIEIRFKYKTIGYIYSLQYMNTEFVRMNIDTIKAVTYFSD